MAALDSLELLTVIVESGSFVRAGERFGLSQSGVSRAVARLEERAGVRLLDRSPRAVTLTDEGRRFHAAVQPLVEAIEEAFDTTAAAKDKVRGRLRINIDPFLARYFLAPRLDELLAKHPELEIDLVARDHADHFISEGFDVAVRFGEVPQQGFVGRKLAQSRVVTCASPAYLKRRGRPRHPRDLTRDHECILYRDPSTGRPFDWEFHRGRTRLKVEVKGRLLVNDFAVALSACLAGHGIAQPVEIGVSDQLRDGNLVDLFPGWGDELFPIHALYPSKRLVPAKIRAFLEFIAQPLK